MRRLGSGIAAAFALAATLFAADERVVPLRLLRPPLWEDPDDKPIPEPKERPASEIFDLARNTWFRQLDIGYKGLQGADRPALNVNAWDEVPDSSWFVNRIGRRAMTVEEIEKGAPGLPPGPGKWYILRLKTAGYTPGLHFHDTAGERFVLKLDLPAAPERNSAADKIGSLITYAAGYHAPFNTIVRFRAEDLALDAKATYEDPLGRKRPMTENDLTEALSRVSPREDGTYRALASHYIRGVPKGYFPYWGTRKDDPNDLVPHELRRELRGFRVIASWFNHVDTKEVNTFDAYVTVDGRSYLRHYFIDFGSTMGSGNFKNGPCRIGHEHLYDAPAIFKSLVTFGAWERPWEANCEIPYEEVGHFDTLFEPARWKPNYPNLAFEEADASDAYWGAKIVIRFTNEHIRALAEAGKYSREEVADYVERVFRERRDRIGRYWLEQVTPLESFALEESPTTWSLRFADLAVEYGYITPGSRAYRFEVKDIELRTLFEGASREPGVIRFAAPGDVPFAPRDRWGRSPFVVVDLETVRSDGEPALPVRVVIGREESQPGLHVLGWEHGPRLRRGSTEDGDVP
jgi:hypothetical protein